MPSSSFKYPKHEKLKDKEIISKLFQSRQLTLSKHLSLYYLTDYSNDFVKIGFAVPKKLIKKAVHRNLIKRRLREAFRLNKNLLLPLFQNNNSLQFPVCFIVYKSNQILDYKEIQRQLISIFTKTASRHKNAE